MKTARERYDAAIAERDRLHREAAKIAGNVTTVRETKRLLRAAAKQDRIADGLIDVMIAEGKARDASQPTGQQGDGQ